MLTLSEIRARVRVRHEASSSARWVDADIDAAINDGIGELSEATRYFEQWASIPLREKRTYYDLRGWADGSILSINAVWHENGNRWVTPASNKDIDIAQWEKTAGPPYLWFTRGLYWFGMFPRVSADTDQWVRVFYAAVAPALKEDGEEPKQLPDEFVPALEEFALYELTQRDGDTNKAMFWWAKYKEREAVLEQHMAHRISTARTGAIGRG